MVLLEKKLKSCGELYWQDTLNNKFYRRVICGVAWPGQKPGFAVIIAEDDNEDKLLRDHHLFVINETEERDMTEFIRRLSAWRGIYSIDSFYGNPTNKAARELLSQFNQNLPDKNRDGLHIEMAPLIEDQRSFEFCVQIIRRRLLEDRKTLFLGKSSRLPGILAAAGDTLMTSGADDFPAIAALGYAVGALDVWKPMERRYDPAQNEPYNVFTLEQNAQGRMTRL